MEGLQFHSNLLVMAMASNHKEERTEISYALITNKEDKVEEKSFVKIIDKTFRKPKVCSPLSHTSFGQEKTRDSPRCSDLKQRTVNQGNKPLYHKLRVDEKKLQTESSSDKASLKKTQNKKVSFSQAVYNKNFTEISEQSQTDFSSYETKTSEKQKLTLDPKSSQLVLSISGKRSRVMQPEQTLFFSCTDEQLALHTMRCSIYSSLGGSWSIINPDECKRVCFQCFNKQKVEKFDDLTPGDHIAIHRAAGYEHHAIVIEVNPDPDDNTRGLLRVIHRSGHAKTVVKGILLCMITIGHFGNLAYLREENVKFNLRKDDVYIIQYKNKPFTRSKIIRRARAEVGKDNTHFNIAADNCEHFANWCATGEYYSHQIGLIKGALQNLLCSDNEGYDRMLNYLSENGLMCDDCLKEARKLQEKFRLNQA